MAICCILPSEATNLRMSLLILALISHSISRLAATCERIGLTKDWAVVLVKREQNTSLSGKRKKNQQRKKFKISIPKLAHQANFFIFKFR